MLQGESVVSVSSARAAAGGKANGKWVGREGFVAEAAVQFDRMNATIARLERELEKTRSTVAEVAEEAARAKRFQSFEVSLENSRDYKITDLQRLCRDLRSRLDAIEGDKSTFRNLHYRSFEPIDRKLAQLSGLQAQLDAMQEAARRHAVLFIGALVVTAIALVSHFII